jgi:hypothetical protein
VVQARIEEDVVKYMLLMWGEGSDSDGAPETEPDTAADEPGEACWMPWAREMQERGVVLHDGAALASDSATVRVSGSEVLVTDGPFAETKEQIGGYDVIECASLDEAIHAASRHPVALAGGIVEVRSVVAI